MATNLRRLVAAAVLVGGAALTGGSPPAGADYVPFTIVDPTSGPAGTVITATGDTWCATTTQQPGENIQPGIPGVVVVEFGVMEWPPELGTESELDEVLASTTVEADIDGMWTAQITVPAGTPPGDRYGVMGHCTVEYEEGETTTTTEVAPSTTDAPDAPAAGAGAGAGEASTRQARATLEIDFFPAQFEVTEAAEPVPTTSPTGAAPATAVPGQADFTG